MRAPRRIAVFASGGGSNLTAILDHFATPRAAHAATVVLVLSNRASSGALVRAAARHLPALVLRDPGDAAEIDADLHAHHVDLIALAGYLRLVPDAISRRFRGAMINVHPAPLPAFGGAGMYGAKAHEAVLRSGSPVSAATVHFVDEQYDRGPVIASWPVVVRPDDTAETLGARVLAVEHVLYPRALEAVALGRVTLTADGSVSGVARDCRPDATFAGTTTDLSSLAPDIDAAFGL